MKAAVIRFAGASVALALALAVNTRSAMAAQEVPTCAWCQFAYDICVINSDYTGDSELDCGLDRADCRWRYCK